MSPPFYWKTQDLGPFKKYNTVKRDCIVCGSKRYSPWAKVDYFRAVKCKRCGFIWMRPFLNQEGLDRYYGNYIGKRLVDTKKMRQRALQYKQDAAFIERYVDRGKVLDIGCSGGFFLAEFNKKFRKYGTEVALDSVQYAKKHYSFGKNVHHVDVLNAPFKEGTFDLITMRGVIEHVPDPRAVIKKVSGLLKKGGYFYITATPNGASFAADIYREHWTLFDPITHLWHFSPEHLERLGKKHKLKLVTADFPYLGTPYENVRQDVREVARAMELVTRGNRNKLSISPPFWGSIMTLVFQKQR